MNPFKPYQLARVVLVMASLATRLPAQTPDDTVRVGDRVLLRVEGEPQLSDTFTVKSGPALTVPNVGDLTVKGVRRADIEPYLARELGRFVRAPVVHARVLVRLAVFGEVERPGFYAVPADAVFSEAIMTAGGPTRDAKFSRLRIERDQGPVWSGETLQQSIARGLTVGQMKLRSGDRIVIPRRRDATATAQVFGALLAIPVAIYGLMKLF